MLESVSRKMAAQAGSRVNMRPYLQIMKAKGIEYLRAQGLEFKPQYCKIIKENIKHKEQLEDFEW
jgi:hypothetical protein